MAGEMSQVVTISPGSEFLRQQNWIRAVRHLQPFFLAILVHKHVSISASHQRVAAPSCFDIVFSQSCRAAPAVLGSSRSTLTLSAFARVHRRSPAPPRCSAARSYRWRGQEGPAGLRAALESQLHRYHGGSLLSLRTPLASAAFTGHLAGETQVGAGQSVDAGLCTLIEL
jgi:hypothetical protein